MIDAFAERVVTELKNVTDLTEAKYVANQILDAGDFQGNIPELQAAVEQMTSVEDIQLLMWRTASSGLEKKARYG